MEIMTSVLRRAFSTKRDKRALAGIYNRLELMKQGREQFDVEESFEDVSEDVAEYEADFMNVAESHKMHEGELAVKKEHLKQQIVISKYFKEKEPRFLTFAEKELIRTLHNTNPDEWTIERLSESFPALPETIRKILHAKWMPKSVDNVMRYDNVVVENWKKLRKGKLAVSPILRDHLMKFKDRKIIMTDRESLAKNFIPSKPEFKKPNSQLFTNIVQTYLNQKHRDMKSLPQEDNSNKKLDALDHSDTVPDLFVATDSSPTAIDNPDRFILNKKKHLRSTSQAESEGSDLVAYRERKKTQQPLTLNEFVKITLKSKDELSPEEGVTMMDVYKELVADNQIQAASEVNVASDKAVSVPKENSVISRDKRYSNIAMMEDNNLVDTYVKVWHKKVDTECNYVNPIKIAKHLYKSGMTYRIGDCYYDDDGEFLYRVPGMHS